MMEPTVRDILCGLIRRYGHSLCEDPGRCQGMLNDLLRGEHRREVFVLISALKAGIAEDLLRSGVGVPIALLFGRLRHQLEHDLAMTGAAAQWAVETWARALGITAEPVTPSAPIPRPRPRPQQRPKPPATAIPARAQTSTDQPPDIHGWPADKVQELQKAAAKRLGRPVCSRDPEFEVRLKGRIEVVTRIAPPEMVIIPAGRFLMGSPASEPARCENEGPRHPVTITRPFAIGRHAITRGEFAAFVAASDYRTDAERSGAEEYTFWREANLSWTLPLHGLRRASNRPTHTRSSV